MAEHPSVSLWLSSVICLWPSFHPGCAESGFSYFSSRLLGPDILVSVPGRLCLWFGAGVPCGVCSWPVSASVLSGIVSAAAPGPDFVPGMTQLITKRFVAQFWPRGIEALGMFVVSLESYFLFGLNSVALSTRRIKPLGRGVTAAATQPLR